jgi:hypothetical protein
MSLTKLERLVEKSKDKPGNLLTIRETEREEALDESKAGPENLIA